MKLRADELNWIEERMKTYQIKYRNVYNEILYHVVTAIEEKRQSGDSHNIENLFQQVVNKHFGGSEGIKNLEFKHEENYKEGIKKLWIQSLKHYLNWPMLIFTVMVLLLGGKIPNTEVIKSAIIILCILMACSPPVFAYFLLRNRVMITTDGKRSFLKIHLIRRASLPAAIFFNLAYCWSPVVMANMSIIIFLVIMILFVWLNLAALHFCRQFTTLNPTTR